MPALNDFFFFPYPTPQERRLQAALDDGLAHGSRIEPHDPTPEDAVTLLFSTKLSSPIEQVSVYYTLDGSEPAGEKGRVGHGQVVFASRDRVESRENETIQQWRAILPPQADGTLVRYRADGWSERNTQEHWIADRVEPVSMPPRGGRIFAYHVDRWLTPQWWYDAVVYQVFIDRFSNAHDEPPLLEHDAVAISDFFGGTLRGVIEKLDYIQALGANCLWLSPLIESPTHHGYNASDYHTVAKRYGTNAVLKQLIQEAHKRGMRVMLDLAANHTSNEHAAFLDALHNPTSPTYTWYGFDDDATGFYRSYAAVTDMPELRTDNPQVQEYLFGVAHHWLSDFGADALRLDYVPGPSHAFWTLFQRAVKTQFPQALTIGEISGPLAEIADYAGRMDAFMDFPLTEVLRSVFAQRTSTVSALLTFLEKRQSDLPPSMSRATLLDNHDMHRFLWLAHEDKARLQLAAACHLTLEGTPIIYYGTEVGLSQYGDAFQENAYARAPMFWDERQDMHLYAYYRQLLTLRHTYPTLRYGKTRIVPVQVVSHLEEDDKQQVGAYLRILADHYLLVVLNNTEREIHVQIALNEVLAEAGIRFTEEEMLQDILQQPQPHILLKNGYITCTLSAMAASVLEKENY